MDREPIRASAFDPRDSIEIRRTPSIDPPIVETVDHIGIDEPGDVVSANGQIVKCPGSKDYPRRAWASLEILLDLNTCKPPVTRDVAAIVASTADQRAGNFHATDEPEAVHSGRKNPSPPLTLPST